MRFRTIWSPFLRGYSMRERFQRTGEELLIKIAHRLPRQLAYRSFIDSGVRYMKGHEVVPDVRYMTLLERFGHEADA